MPPISLEDYRIFLRREGTSDSISDCPSQLKDLFALILSIQSLDWDRFGGILARNVSLQVTPVMQYESELKLEAEQLSATCLDYRRLDDPETDWVRVQQPIVFYRFNREAEEMYSRRRHHHCFICGKHFPLRSRPLLGGLKKKSFDERIRGVHGDDIATQDANVCDAHFNLPNFDTSTLKYLKHEDENIKEPDLTVGLLLWSKHLCHAPPGMSDEKLNKIMRHDLVRPFRHDILHELEEAKYMEPLFAFPQPKKGNHVSRVSRSTINFPFILWEAKKAWEGDPVAQNALKVKMILEWQQSLAFRANISWVPLMFHFVSVGSEWKLYACHAQPPKNKGKSSYLFRLLWSGDCANETKALQLLYLMDIIALWGQFQYKPFAGACIRVLKKGTRRDSYLNVNLLEYQRIINDRNFLSIRRDDIATNPSTEPSFKLQRAGTLTPEGDLDKQIMQRMRSLKLEHYIIPERDGFIWLLHRELRGSDLLVIRVNTDGVKLAPLVIFDDSDWRSKDFRKIIVEERARMPQNVETDFRYDANNTSALERCFNATAGTCALSELQFCAILPLKRQRRAMDEIEPQREFEPLEKLLGLQNLIAAAQTMNELWCSCQQAYTGAMILCDSTRCMIGWYHNRCVGLPEDYENHDWLCRACKKSGSITYTNYDNNKNFEQDILDASDARIQRVKSLSRAWNNHDWPDDDKVRKVMYRKICCEIEMDTNVDQFQDTVKCLESERYNPASRRYNRTTRCWAVLRHDPSRLTHIRQRFRASRQP